jgi:hypothetical protein
LTKENISLTKENISLTKENISLTKENISLTKEIISMTKEMSGMVKETPSLVMEMTYFRQKIVLWTILGRARALACGFQRPPLETSGMVAHTKFLPIYSCSFAK